MRPNMRRSRTRRCPWLGTLERLPRLSHARRFRMKPLGQILPTLVLGLPAAHLPLDVWGQHGSGSWNWSMTGIDWHGPQMCSEDEWGPRRRESVAHQRNSSSSAGYRGVRCWRLRRGRPGLIETGSGTRLYRQQRDRQRTLLLAGPGR